MVRRRRLGERLRELREARGYTLQALAAELGWSHTKLSRLETAKVRADLADVMDLVEALGVKGPEEERLIALARQANQRGWWRAYTDVPQRQAGSAEIEASAVSIREYAQVYFPGLLQTKEYAAVRLAEPTGVEVNVEAAVEMRLARQAVLQGTPYVALIDEAVLRRPTAPADVQRAQLARLLELARLPAVTLRVLPFAAELPHFTRPLTSFSLYSLSDADLAEMVLVETETSDLYLGDAEDLARYDVAWERLISVALGEEQSATLIRELTTSD